MKFEFDPEKNEGLGLFLMIAIFFGGTFLLNLIVWSFYRMSDDKEQAQLQAERLYTGFIKFLKWISVIAILLVLVMGLIIF